MFETFLFLIRTIKSIHVYKHEMTDYIYRCLSTTIINVKFYSFVVKMVFWLLKRFVLSVRLHLYFASLCGAFGIDRKSCIALMKLIIHFILKQFTQRARNFWLVNCLFSFPAARFCSTLGSYRYPALLLVFPEQMQFFIVFCCCQWLIWYKMGKFMVTSHHINWFV